MLSSSKKADGQGKKISGDSITDIEMLSGKSTDLNNSKRQLTLLHAQKTAALKKAVDDDKFCCRSATEIHVAAEKRRKIAIAAINVYEKSRIVEVEQEAKRKIAKIKAEKAYKLLEANCKIQEATFVRDKAVKDSHRTLNYVRSMWNIHPEISRLNDLCGIGNPTDEHPDNELVSSSTS